MKRITEQMFASTPSSDLPKSEIEEVIQSLRDITREIEKLTTEKQKNTTQ